jgi:hypothetical protein
MRNLALAVLCVGLLGAAPRLPRQDDPLTGSWTIELRVDTTRFGARPGVRRRSARVTLAAAATRGSRVETPTHLGRFEGDLADLGVRKPRGDDRGAIGVLRGDRVRVVLDPGVDHGRMEMDGELREDTIRGTWVVSGYVMGPYGTFEMRRVR